MYIDEFVQNTIYLCSNKLIHSQIHCSSSLKQVGLEHGLRKHSGRTTAPVDVEAMRLRLLGSARGFPQVHLGFASRTVHLCSEKALS